MTFLLDENFPKTAAGVLTRSGHLVHDSRLLGLQGADDALVVRAAVELGATILTTDRDFYHTLPHLFPGHFGVVVVALRRPSRAAILERLHWFLANISEADLRGRAFQLRDRSWVACPPIASGAG